MNIFKKNVLVTVISLIIGAGITSFTFLDEGMFPLSDLNRVDLKKAGLEISQTDIFNPGQVGLVDALVQVGGCTGSFISDEGLIITNHHCAFGAVRLASTPENDYLTNGFVARQKESEIKAQGLTIRITDSYEDVSSRVLQAAQASSDPAQRIHLITQERLNIAKEAELKDPSIKAEVSEMFIGKSYVLFRYKTIEDVRLVYVPQQIIGEFGGDTDNWIWPRHTGDFSFLRAYVAPDGSPAAYSVNNVPYKPKKFLKVNPNGVKEEDFAFILGYPGRTFRHRPAQYIEYQERFLLPYTAALYDFQNNEMVKAGNNDRAIELSLATRIKSNANVMKNYRGKMKGLKAIDLHKNKQDEDLALAQFIENDSQLKGKYGSLMADIDNLYKDIFSDAERELWFNQIYASTRLLNVARQINAFKLALGNSANKEEMFQSNLPRLKSILNSLYESYNFSTDSAIFTKMLLDASKFSDNQSVTAVNKRSDLVNFAKKSLSASKLKDQEFVFNKLLLSPKSLLSYSDNLLSFQNDLQTQQAALKPELDRREGVLNQLMGDYVAVKEQFQKRDFIPDANSTLRLTYGYIRGYSPADATYVKPFTTIRGIIEKGALDQPDFRYPSKIREVWEAKDFGPYAMKELGDVPVNLLYNMDTTGGNSGSPIMNAKGELIGVNFDRAYDATINDFAWNESYSRSIGVDIRYVLWVADKIDNADFLLKEIGI
ncbi:S46 family peptidase [Albibacterium bauzanense]|uniref:Dipeptidyl-peptidase n=1 Tax=Albibacterium bauzanense TaxID=653929 RepID=A0A4R1M1A0_9SPHI|nr:S46 family peptidase [Albibacterium bauzanense]TCK85097.1 peptidase S46-like protein [Albibacterium bauzanense]